MPRGVALLALVVSCSALAAAPMVLTHSGRLTDANGSPLNGPHDLQIALFDTETSPAALWTATYPQLPVLDGYFAVSLVQGAGGEPLDVEDFADGEVWVQTSVGGAALGGRQRLASVPYALVAGSATPGIAPFVTLQSSDGLRCTRMDMATVGYGVVHTAVDCQSGVPIGLTTTSGVWSMNGQPLESCKAYIDHPTYAGQGDGVYLIDPDGPFGANAPFNAYCEMSTDGGGWTFVGHVNNNYAAGNFFSGDSGTYLTTRADNNTTYSAGGRILQKLAHTEMMVTLDTPTPATAAASSKIVFFRYAVGHSGFNQGPNPCVGLINYSYRTTTSGAFTAGGTTNSCGTEWYARTAGNASYLTLFHPTALGPYWGSGMGGDNSWYHDAWWYTR